MTSTTVPSSTDIDALRERIQSTSITVAAEGFHSCRCWDDLGSCSLPLHAVAKANAAAARAEAHAVIVDLARRIFVAPRPADVEAISAALSVFPWRSPHE